MRTRSFFPKIGLMDKDSGAVAVMTLTPGEAAIIGGDIRHQGVDGGAGLRRPVLRSLLIVGQLADVESAVRAVVDTLGPVLGFTPHPSPGRTRPRALFLLVGSSRQDDAPATAAGEWT